MRTCKHMLAAFLTWLSARGLSSSWAMTSMTSAVDPGSSGCIMVG